MGDYRTQLPNWGHKFKPLQSLYEIRHIPSLPIDFIETYLNFAQENTISHELYATFVSNLAVMSHLKPNFLPQLNIHFISYSLGCCQHSHTTGLRHTYNP
jgi:hypothetical protein